MLASSWAFTYYGALISAIATSTLISLLLITCSVWAGGVIKGFVKITWRDDFTRTDVSSTAPTPAVTVNPAVPAASRAARQVVYPGIGRSSAYPSVGRSSSRRAA